MSVNSRDCGYDVDVYLSPGEYQDWKWVPVDAGHVIQKGDEFYHLSDERYWSLFAYIGLEIKGPWTKAPVRRRREKPIVAVQRWSCGHGKDAGDRFCVVCSAFMRHVDR